MSGVQSTWGHVDDKLSIDHCHTADRMNGALTKVVKNKVKYKKSESIIIAYLCQPLRMEVNFR